MNYSIKKQVDHSFIDAVSKTKVILAEEGFGILTEIDVKMTLKDKIDVEWSNYIILGVCNPSFAYKALQEEKEIGLFLPCNVIVYEDGGNVFVSAILPTVVMEMVSNKSLMKIAGQAEEKLKKVMDKLSPENQDQDQKSWKAFDLVCGMELNMTDVRHSFEHNGKEYYFCSRTCKNHFVEDPDKYVGN
jgi:uncharacterized protein (DUF302 family)/YHS domain-containing protein